MRIALLTTSLLVLAAASPALAQTPVQRGETYVSAPWWMRAPVTRRVRRISSTDRSQLGDE